MNYAIVLAGGVGLRVGAGVPKQFIEVLGKPMLIYALEVFENDPLIDEIVLVCVDTHMEFAKESCAAFGIAKARTFVSGGRDFTASCANGMRALRGRCGPDDIVVIASADRPFVSLEEVDDSIAVCREYGCGIAARDCALCMFVVGEDRTRSRDYQRANLVQTATPWAFAYGRLMDALDAYERGALPPCEDYPVAIYVAAGNEAHFSASSPRNIKITERSDVALMELMLEEEGT